MQEFCHKLWTFSCIFLQFFFLFLFPFLFRPLFFFGAGQLSDHSWEKKLTMSIDGLGSALHCVFGMMHPVHQGGRVESGGEAQLLVNQIPKP